MVICEPQKWNNTIFIWELLVLSQYRGRHIGTALINKITEHANRDGYRAIRLETQNTNVPAISFYLKCGFTIDGVELSLYSNTDVENGEVAVFMLKKISEG
ncbi:GNAT family N-acetyltransferase [Paenibacillus haidiansis]|uniref:GNAT family N-acetyltransferase n=1 Tax=Paenibacillus haidiansis TaxID=1574488 RepID=UPI0039E0711C